MDIQFCGPRLEAAECSEALNEASRRVVARGWFLFGPELEQFEGAFAKSLDVPHCIGVASGTDALAIALRASGVGGGDEVIAPSFTAVATAAAIVKIGAVPVFVDIDPLTYCIDPDQIERAVTPRTKAIVPVHLYGHPADMARIEAIAKAHDIVVVEDCAQAYGAMIDGRKVGSFGGASAFSFYPTKNLGALGDGGAVVTSDPEIAARAQSERQYGWDAHRESLTEAWNSRLDEIQAAFLLAKLERFPAWHAGRQVLGRRLERSADGTPLRAQPQLPGVVHGFHLFVLQTKDRNMFQKYMAEHGIHTDVHYPSPVHVQGAYRRYAGSSPLPLSETASASVVSLPLHPAMEERQIAQVLDCVAGWAG